MSQLVNITICVDAAYVDVARQLCACVEGGSNMFTRAYGDGEEVAGYISAGPVLQEFADVLPIKTFNSEGQLVGQAAFNTAYIIALAGQSGVVVTHKDLITLFEHVDVSTQLPDVVMQRLGYSLL